MGFPISESINNVFTWTVPNNALEELREMKMGIEFFNGIPEKHIKHSSPFLEALVDCYNPVDMNFIFNGIPLLFGLEDIFYIMGLPIDGIPVSGVIGSIDDKAFQAAFGRNSTGAFKAGNKTKIKHSWLKKTFKDMSNLTPDHADWKPYIRAYLMYIIGSLILPDASSSYVSSNYLQLLSDLTIVGQYSWGSAALANFHYPLIKRKTNKNKCLTGMAYALMLWAIEYIKPLRELIKVENKPT